MVKVPKYYKSIDNKFKILDLITLDHNNNKMYHNIRIGGKKEGCIVIEVDEKDYGLSENYKIAHITSIEYNKNCNKDGNLQSGEGTIEMILFSLNVTQHLCPWVTVFSLRDASARMCQENGPEINLSDMSIALYGKTWYERHFNAKIKNNDTYELYKRFLKKLKSKTFKNASPYEKFSRAFNIKFSENIVLIYNNSETFKTFFKNLNETLSKEDICLLLQPWISKFIRDLILERNFLIENEWIIKNNKIDIELDSIEEGQYRQYGGKFKNFIPKIKLRKIL